MKKHYVQFALAGIFLSVSPVLFAQNVGINTTGATPSTNAILDLNTGNPNNLGLIIPSVTLGASLMTFSPPMFGVNTAKDVGMIVYNSVNTNQPIGYYYWNGTTWVSIGGSSSLSGTVNYLARWITANTLGIGVAQDNGTSVGISAAVITPKSLLDVAGNVTIGATYAGADAAPTSGMIVQGPSAIGNTAANYTASKSVILDLTNTALPNGTAAAFLWPINPSPTTNFAASGALPVTGEEIYNSTTGCFQFYNGTTWLTADCPCNAAPSGQTISPSCTGPFEGSSVTYSSSITTGVFYNWSAAANSGTPTVSSTGASSTTITWPSTATTGTVTSTLTNSCASSTTTYTISLTSESLTGPTTIYSSGGSSTTYTYSVTAVTGAGYAWTLTGSGGTITAGALTDAATVTASGTGTFTIQCVITSSGGCTTTLSETVTVTTCSATTAITPDPNPASYATSTFSATTFFFGFTRYTAVPNMTITTTDDNDLVLVALCGVCNTEGGFASTTRDTATNHGGVTFSGASAGTATFLSSSQSTPASGILAGEGQGDAYAPIILYWFAAPNAGTYTITITEPNNYSANLEENFAVALAGFCTAPVAPISNFIKGEYINAVNASSGQASLTTDLAPAAPVGAYVFAAFNNYWETGAETQSFETWSNLATPYYYQAALPTILYDENYGDANTHTAASVFGEEVTAAQAAGGAFVFGYDTATPTAEQNIGYASIIVLLLENN